MFSKLSSSTIICVILGLILFYYYNKFQDSEKEYFSLHKKFDQMYTENQKMKTRLKDFQYYKNDVSKTFKILDKELEQINEHIYGRSRTFNEDVVRRQGIESNTTDQIRETRQPFRTDSVDRRQGTFNEDVVRRQGTFNEDVVRRQGT
jgi:hypothetical protein